jgi:hypothetical protein
VSAPIPTSQARTKGDRGFESLSRSGERMKSHSFPHGDLLVESMAFTTTNPEQEQRSCFEIFDKRSINGIDPSVINKFTVTSCYNSIFIPATTGSPRVKHSSHIRKIVIRSNNISRVHRQVSVYRPDILNGSDD